MVFGGHGFVVVDQADRKKNFGKLGYGYEDEEEM
jgi:hypothetical protein